MNGDEYSGPTMSEFNPSWMEDGGGITGEQGEPSFDSNAAWDTNAWSRQNMDQGDPFSPSTECIPEGSPDTSKIYVKATHFVDGQWTCYWLETTICP